MTRPPPVPPQNQPPKQRNLADQGNAPGAGAKESGTRTTDRNAHKGRHADISQNTRHQGYQQDR